MSGPSASAALPPDPGFGESTGADPQGDLLRAAALRVEELRTSDSWTDPDSELVEAVDSLRNLLDERAALYAGSLERHVEGNLSAALPNRVVDVEVTMGAPELEPGTAFGLDDDPVRYLGLYTIEMEISVAEPAGGDGVESSAVRVTDHIGGIDLVTEEYWGNTGTILEERWKAADIGQMPSEPGLEPSNIGPDDLITGGPVKKPVKFAIEELGESIAEAGLDRLGEEMDDGDIGWDVTAGPLAKAAALGVYETIADGMDQQPDSALPRVGLVVGGLLQMREDLQGGPDGPENGTERSGVSRGDEVGSTATEPADVGGPPEWLIPSDAGNHVELDGPPSLLRQPAGTPAGTVDGAPPSANQEGDAAAGASTPGDDDLPDNSPGWGVLRDDLPDNGPGWGVLRDDLLDNEPGSGVLLRDDLPDQATSEGLGVDSVVGDVADLPGADDWCEAAVDGTGADRASEIDLGSDRWSETGEVGADGGGPVDALDGSSIEGGSAAPESPESGAAEGGE